MKQVYKFILLLCSSMLACTAIFSQNVAVPDKHNDHIGRIALNPVVPDQIDTSMPGISLDALEVKLGQIANLNGTGGSLVNPRFIISAKVVVLSKDILSTAPPMTALNLEFNLYIGDGQKRKIFASKMLTLKGVGTNPAKAYYNAINHIKADDPQIQAFVIEGKKKIIDYYTMNCSEVIRDAQIIASQKGFDVAIWMLTSVPEDCDECFKKCMEATAPIYKKYRDYKCEVMLMRAKAQWAASPNVSGADSAAALIAGIDPESECYGSVQKLVENITSSMNEQNNKAWELKMKEQKDKNELAKDMIDVYRNIAIQSARDHQNEIKVKIGNW